MIRDYVLGLILKDLTSVAVHLQSISESTFQSWLNSNKASGRPFGLVT
jgi:hypothetical protein